MKEDTMGVEEEVKAAADAATNSNQQVADALNRQADASYASREASAQSDAERDLEQYPVI